MRGSYVVAELSRHLGRTVSVVVVVGLGVVLFLSLEAYGSGYRVAARAPLTQIGADVVAQLEGERPERFEGAVFPHSTAPIHARQVDEIARLEGVESLAQAMFFWSFQDRGLVVALGIEPEKRVGPGRLGAGVRTGRFLRPRDRGVGVVDTTFARQRRIEVGTKLEVAGRRFSVVGTVDSGRTGQVANANVYLPLADAQQIVAAARGVRAVHVIRPSDANVLFLRADPRAAPEVANAVAGILGKRTIVTTPRSFDEVLSASFGLVDRFGSIVGVAALAVAIAGLLRAAAANLLERRRDVALMRAVGWRRRDVRAQLAAETLVVTSLGALAGVLLALAVAWGLGHTNVTVPVPWELSPTPHFLPGGARQFAVTIPFPAEVSGGAAAVAVAATLAGATAVSLWLARRSSSIKPSEVWRGA